MAGINVNGIGRNPYADSYLTSAKNRSNTTSKDTFVNAVKKVEESKNTADTSNVMYPGDVTIDYPPRINNAVNNSVVSEKSKDEMSLDEYKQWVATVYKGNIIKNLIMDCQSYTKYRPNETTGGIFVSWRRKEELPTGA